MTAPDTLTLLQKDALREVSSVAAGHAATALSDLTGHRIMIGVPNLTLCSIEELPRVLGYDRLPVVTVAMRVLGDLNGRLVFLMPAPAAHRFTDRLLGREAAQPTPAGFDEMAESCLKETGNVLAGAYTAALGSLMKALLMLSIPHFGIDPPDNLLSAGGLEMGAPGDLVLCVETRFRIDAEMQEDLGGHILMVPEAAALESLFSALGLG